MFKRNAIILVTAALLLTACGSGNKTNTNDPAVAEATAVSSNVRTVVSDRIVDEFEEERFVFEPADLVCDLPKGFRESEDYPGEYYCKNYPKDVSTINQVVIESDENPTIMSEDDFRAMIDAEFMDAYGETPPINITQFDKMMIEGRPALVIMYDYTFRQNEFHVLTYVIFNGTETNYVTFMEGPGAKWMDEFIKCGNTIGFRPIEG